EIPKIRQNIAVRVGSGGGECHGTTRIGQRIGAGLQGEGRRRIAGKRTPVYHHIRPGIWAGASLGDERNVQVRFRIVKRAAKSERRGWGSAGGASGGGGDFSSAVGLVPGIPVQFDAIDLRRRVGHQAPV